MFFCSGICLNTDVMLRRSVQLLQTESKAGMGAFSSHSRLIKMERKSTAKRGLKGGLGVNLTSALGAHCPSACTNEGKSVQAAVGLWSDRYTILGMLYAISKNITIKINKTEQECLRQLENVQNTTACDHLKLLTFILSNYHLYFLALFFFIPLPFISLLLFAIYFSATTLLKPVDVFLPLALRTKRAAPPAVRRWNCAWSLWVHVFTKQFLIPQSRLTQR